MIVVHNSSQACGVHNEHSLMKAMVKDRANFPPLRACKQNSALPGRALLTLIHSNLGLHHSLTPVHLTPQAAAQVPSTHTMNI